MGWELAKVNVNGGPSPVPSDRVSVCRILVTLLHKRQWRNAKKAWLPSVSVAAWAVMALQRD